MAEITGEQRRRLEHRFVLIFAIAAGVVALVPAFFGWLGAPAGSSYLGIQYNTDDHMVYAAWMRQAMDGHFFFDNRFTTDAQPGLTVHVYFFLLGLIAKLLGIPLAMTLARVGFSVLFVFLLHRLVKKLDWSIYATKLALALAVVGGGLGFLVWQTFGVDISKPGVPDVLRSLLLGHLPTDVWQPEGFVLPSMLTNGLFMVSLCLIVFVLVSMLEARDSWKPVLPGAVAMAVLMNIHSYDVLIVTLAMVGFLVMTLARRQATRDWFVRAAVVGAGAIPSALWFVYVLRHDTVFQSRAATETYSPNFRPVLFGYVLLILLAIGGMTSQKRDKWRTPAGLGLLGLVILGLAVAAQSHTEGYFLGPVAWLAVMALGLIALGLLASENAAWNLVASWAVMGLFAIYFPGLFQRKLAMGLSIPWALLAAIGVEALLRRQERSARNLATILFLVLLSASSVRWFTRELELIKANVSNTTVHPVYLNSDSRRIMAYLNRLSGRHVLVAMPGIPSPAADAEGHPIPDTFGTPLVPDLNPIASGLTGVYTYAGHWSETPDYGRRRNAVTAIFSRQEPMETKRTFLNSIGADYLIAPVPEAFGFNDLDDLRPLGTVVVDGSQFSLVRLSK